MGWDIKSDGFGVVLSPQLPGLKHQELRPALEGFLQRHGLERDDFCCFLLHPGGRKILETAESVRTPAALLGRAAVLRQHVVGDGSVRAAARAPGPRSRYPPAGGIRAGLFGVFCRP